MGQEPTQGPWQGNFFPPCMGLKRDSSVTELDLRRPSLQIIRTGRIWPKAPPGTSLNRTHRLSSLTYQTTHNRGEANPPDEIEKLRGKGSGCWLTRVRICALRSQSDLFPHRTLLFDMQTTPLPQVYCKMRTIVNPTLQGFSEVCIKCLGSAQHSACHIGCLLTFHKLYHLLF